MDQPQVVYDPDVVDQLKISGFLSEVVAHIRQRVAKRQEEVPISGLRALISMQKRPIDLASALRHDQGLSLIIDIKRQTHYGKMLFPSRYEPDALARYYAEAGVQAISVATDPHYYRGEIHHLTYVSEVVDIPIIRQDFVFDRYQIYEARAAGADGVILIAALLGEYRLWDLLSIAQRLRMTAVVQVENEEELARALESDPRVIGISNVDWRTLDVDLGRTLRLREQIPDHIAVISMGGIRRAEDVTMVSEAGIDAILVGEAILGAADPEDKIRELYSQIDSDPTDPWRTIE
jgi:indole-3-glycerol phosphate synthase